jgi:hybrid cluster-associated redox disulfide protein
MDRYTRWFILASLGYLAVGGILGLLMIMSPGLMPSLYFSHGHVLLAGFMAMMVFGVGYFILPRFASHTLIWPSMVGVHFWMSNLSLVAFLVARPMAQASGSSGWMGLTHAAALVQALSLLLFTFNLGGTLIAASGKAADKAPNKAPGPAKRGPSAQPGAASLPVVGPSSVAAPPLSASMPVAEVVDRKEGALELLIQAGLRPLQDPQHLEMVRSRGLTLGHACSRHGIPIDELLVRLQALPDRAGAATPELTSETIIGELVERYPGAREVLRERFGEGCFTCPGFATETLAQGAMMHGVPIDDLLAEMREACSS